MQQLFVNWLSFNTASGRCCCNLHCIQLNLRDFSFVSIPQAVGVVATFNRKNEYDASFIRVSIPQAVGVVATKGVFIMNNLFVLKFQYRKR